MLKLFEDFHNFIMDMLFPITCLSCSQEGSWLCEKCYAKIPLKLEQVCGRCERMLTPGGRTCLDCRKKSPLDGLLVASSYDNRLLRKLVHHYKYRFISDLHPILGRLLSEALLKSDLPLPDLMIPVPLHPRRHRWRGFNQSALLANHIGRNLTPNFDIPTAINILIRKRYTTPQMSLTDFSQRLENMREAFAILNTADIRNKTVLLVDDIATTGSTIFECANILKKAGARQVFAVVIARQNTKNDA